MIEDYPTTLLEMEPQFATEEQCRAYLATLRWPDGFVWPSCGGRKAWPAQRGRLICAACRHQATVTAGTIFQDSRLSLRLWCRAIWQVTSQKNGASALGLQRVLGLGSYQTAWTVLHKLRRAMVRPGRDKLSGPVEVDETQVGGVTPGQKGRGAPSKALVVIAAQEAGAGIGRIRLARIPDGSAEHLHRFIQGAIAPTHLDYYLDEFTFRFNRRSSASRGKLFYRLAQQAVQVPPVPYQVLVGGANNPKHHP